MKRGHTAVTVRAGFKVLRRSPALYETLETQRCRHAIAVVILVKLVISAMAYVGTYEITGLPGHYSPC